MSDSDGNEATVGGRHTYWEQPGQLVSFASLTLRKMVGATCYYKNVSKSNKV